MLLILNSPEIFNIPKENHNLTEMINSLRKYNDFEFTKIISLYLGARDAIESIIARAKINNEKPLWVLD